MDSTRPLTLSRRVILFATATALASGPAAAQQAYAAEVYRDPHCGCCLAWVEHLRASGAFAVQVTETNDMAGVKQRLGVPQALASCHTMSVAGFAIEGHVPARDIIRLIEQRPAGVSGLAVPGMPAGSPGMERSDGRRDAFEVIAFGDGGTTRVFARYAAS